MDVRDPLANLVHECNCPYFRPILRDVERSTSTPIDYRHAFLKRPEMVFRYVVNIRLISCRSDLGPFSPPQRPSPILNVGSVVSHPFQRFVEMPSLHFRSSQPNTHEATARRSPPRRSLFSRHRIHVVEVATGQDRQVYLFNGSYLITIV